MKRGITIAKILTGVLTLLVVNLVTAQDVTFKNRIKAMQDEYASMTDVHIEMNINVFESKSTKSPYLKQDAVIKKQSDNYFYKLSGLEMLANKKYLILVNNDERHISCGLRDIKTEPALTDGFASNLDSLLNFYGTPRLAGKDNDVEHYVLTRTQGDISSIDLYIHVPTNTLQRMDYSYAEGQYVVINFTLFNRNPEFKPDEFSEQRYFEKEGVLKLKDAYSRFRLTQ